MSVALPASKPRLDVQLCAPRGFCAGVVRAIDAVEQALRIYGPPVYVRHEIVHNKYVVEGLRRKGAVFVDELYEVPATGAPVIFSAHGVPKSVPAEARGRELFAIDATCPLVTKVHREAEVHHRRGRTIVLVGHAGHPEVVGTMGQLPDGAVFLVETLEDVARFRLQILTNLAYVTQTTLSVDDTREIVDALRPRFPRHRGAPQGRHLLRDHQSPGGGEGGRAARGCDDRGRFAQFVELAAPEGSRRAGRVPGLAAGSARR